MPLDIYSIWNSPSLFGERGSLNFFRSIRCSISTSRLDGDWLANFRWYWLMALAYCSPRKISSSSLSRRTICDQVGIATLNRIAITDMATRSAAIA